MSIPQFETFNAWPEIKQTAWFNSEIGHQKPVKTQPEIDSNDKQAKRKKRRNIILEEGKSDDEKMKLKSLWNMISKDII